MVTGPVSADTAVPRPGAENMSRRGVTAPLALAAAAEALRGEDTETLRTDTLGAGTLGPGTLAADTPGAGTAAGTLAGADALPLVHVGATA